MKKLLTLIAFILSLSAFAQCPDAGNNMGILDSINNTLKNRPVNVDPNKAKFVSIDSILKDGKDGDRFSNNMFVYTEGYVILVKNGGAESCNCDSTNAIYHDIHIELAKTPNAAKGEVMIVEVTPKLKNAEGLTAKSLKTLVGQKVRIYGYFFFDSEHKQNAANTCHQCTNVLRWTCWEIHPVVKIVVIK